MTEHRDSWDGMAALVVDDDRAVRLILRRMLEKLGFEVEEAHDGGSALRTTKRRPFDLVFTDVSMPGMDGMEFFRQARAAGLKAPVIFLTAVGTASQAQEALGEGASDFIAKPLRIKQLQEAVHAAMTGKDEESGALSIEIDLSNLTEP
jgi:CheY-like chemotaxis protein